MIAVAANERMCVAERADMCVRGPPRGGGGGGRGGGSGVVGQAVAGGGGGGGGGLAETTAGSEQKHRTGNYIKVCLPPGRSSWKVAPSRGPKGEGGAGWGGGWAPGIRLSGKHGPAGGRGGCNPRSFPGRYAGSAG